jgi:hypothetical protein
MLQQLQDQHHAALAQLHRLDGIKGRTRKIQRDTRNRTRVAGLQRQIHDATHNADDDVCTIALEAKE